MTQDDYESLVRRLEQEAATNPAGYRRKLGALAFLGYGYVAASLILLIGGAACQQTRHLGLALGERRRSFR